MRTFLDTASQPCPAPAFFLVNLRAHCKTLSGTNTALHPLPALFLVLAAGILLFAAPSNSLAVQVNFRTTTENVSFSRQQRQAIKTIANATEAEVRKLLPSLPPGITLEIRTGQQVIAETGETGAAVSAGHVRWTIDPGRPEGVMAIVKNHLRSTLFHEFHHLARGWVMSGSAERTSFMDGVISEGMATAFQRDFAGAEMPWGTYPDDVESWVEELSALPIDAAYGQWMFLHKDGRRWIGYRAGTYLVDQAMKVSGKSSAELVLTPTHEIIRLATTR